MLVSVKAEELDHSDNADADEFVFKPAVHERYDVGGYAQYKSIDPH